MARRRYFVRRGLQGRFIAAVLAFALAGAIATAAATLWAASRALDEARFRAHFSERSTRDLLLPVILTVNGAAAAATIAGGIVVALVWFARQARALDALRAQLKGWQRELTPAAASPSAAQAAAEPPDRGWAADLEEAFREAEGALRATYRASEAEATALAADAEKLERAVAEGSAERECRRGLNALGERLGRLDAILSRYRAAGGP